MMKSRPQYKLKRSFIPHAVSLVTLGVFALSLIAHPSWIDPSWLDVVLAGLAFVISNRVAGFFFPARKVRLKVKYIAPTSRDSDVDRQLKEADRVFREVEKFREQIAPTNGTLARHAESLTSTGRKIMDYLAVNSDRAKGMHRFFGYYLPTLEKLLGNYVLLEKHAADGKNAIGTKQEIEDAVVALDGEFTKLLDKLFDETALDISTDIDVLENVIGEDVGSRSIGNVGNDLK